MGAHNSVKGESAGVTEEMKVGKAVSETDEVAKLMTFLSQSNSKRLQQRDGREEVSVQQVDDIEETIESENCFSDEKKVLFSVGDLNAEQKR